MNRKTYTHSSMRIKTVTVVGAGVMGSQIAAYLADAGLSVYLLDIPGKDAEERNAPVLNAMARLKLLKPAPYMLSWDAIKARIIPGNLEDDLAVVAKSDWVLEAVIERLDVKQDVHSRIAKFAPSHIPVTTNTSGILLADMVKGLPQAYASQFFATHFFNPPRYMKLVEVISHAGTEVKLVRDFSHFLTKKLGKEVVFASDTLNFIANRIGVFALLSAAHHGTQLGLLAETVDVLTGKLIARPASATYRTMDVVGLDTSMFVAKNVYDQLPEDPYHSHFRLPEWLSDLIGKGYLGQKTQFTGVYKKSKNAAGKTEILSYRAETGEYVPSQPQEVSWLKEAQGIKDVYARLRFIFDQNDAASTFLWTVFKELFSYSSLLLEEIASSSPSKVDMAMRHGFQWQCGVFEMWQGIGFQAVTKRMMEEKVLLPHWIISELGNEEFSFYRPCPLSEQWALGLERQEWNLVKSRYVDIALPENKVYLPAYPSKSDKRLLKSSDSASLLDIGDDVGLVNFHTKMNAIGVSLLDTLAESVEYASKHFAALLIANDGRAFSAGADLAMILQYIENKEFSAIDDVLKRFQDVMQMIKYATIPVVCAPHGMVLGGGCEVTMHCSHRHVAMESYIGLVEAGVGLIPAAGGSKELALRSYELADHYSTDSMAFLEKAFKTVAMAKVSSSGVNALELGLYPQNHTSFTFAREQQVYEAKGIALQASKVCEYSPRLAKQNIKVGGEPVFETFKLVLYNMLEGRLISAYDAVVAEKLAYVLAGGDVDRGTEVNEEWFLHLERKVFVELCEEEKTKARITHMLKTGKPLRN